MLTIKLYPAVALAVCAVVALANRTDVGDLLTRKKRYLYIPLNIPLPNRPSAQALTTAAPGTSGGDQLPAATVDLDNSILFLINSFRAAHRAPPVTYNTQLRDTALACANAYAAAGSLTTPTCGADTEGETNGFSEIAVPVRGARDVILNPTTGWLAEYPGRPPIGSATYWSNPTLLDNALDYTQMIWVSTTEVGCGYSASPAASLPDFGITSARYIFVCLWTPPGNDDSALAQNVLQDTE